LCKVDALGTRIGLTKLGTIAVDAVKIKGQRQSPTRSHELRPDTGSEIELKAQVKPWCKKAMPEPEAEQERA
jgi:hypothetical protein